MFIFSLTKYKTFIDIQQTIDSTGLKQLNMLTPCPRAMFSSKNNTKVIGDQPNWNYLNMSIYVRNPNLKILNLT